MSESHRVASLNLCLGLRNKKDTVKNFIAENAIEILCLQETEIPVDYPIELLTFKGFNFESENNTVKMRCGVYLSNNVSYLRRNDLEVVNMHVMIIDLLDNRKTRIINVYRPFNPSNNLTQFEFFVNQIEVIKNNTTPSTIVLGDFNLDHSKIYDISYSHKNYFTLLTEKFNPLNLIQLVNFETWSRTINNIVCSSTLDHVYTKDPTNIKAIYPVNPPFGDHVAVIIELKLKQQNKKDFFRRNWSNYSQQKLTALLQITDWSINFDGVQAYWNNFESKLIEIVDLLAPLEPVKDIQNTKTHPPTYIKTKINRRNRLLKNIKSNNNPNDTRLAIKTLNREIKSYFHKVKAKNIRKGIIPGNSKSLWNAVNKAKDINMSSLPETLFENKVKLDPANHATAFANFFSNKVNTIVNQTHVDPGVYNGLPKINCECSFFMSPADILECLKTIKTKNCEGFDRIPQRVLSDGAEYLITPLGGLFKRIYEQKTIPQQWSVSKVIPIHKKGLKSDIENYRPIANLCSTSKLFEKLILKRILSIEKINDVDITGKEQHGFKRNKSTTTLSLQIQSLISRALDEDKHVLMASIDLSAAFDVVNIDLLLERLRIVGLPVDVVELVKVWLTNRSFYVELNDLNSVLHDINSGTIQGSILGPILYALYVAPLFDLTDLSNFADDNFILTFNENKISAITEMESKLAIITKWLTDSGLKVNQSKTELCHFYRKDTPAVEINVNNNIIKSKDNMNVLGVIFDSKLTWAKHISTQINKSSRALHAIKLIRKYFNKNEILALLTSNFYSILFYNSEVWHLPTLKPPLKQLILSASANALKLSQSRPDAYESFINVHKSCNRALPEQFIVYKHAILLHKLYNNHQPQADWIDINVNQVFNSRNTKFRIIKNNTYMVGNNLLSSRLSILNDKIELNDLNLSLDSFKIKYKKILL